MKNIVKQHDDGWHTLPKSIGATFEAMYQGRADGTQEVFPSTAEGYGLMMCTGSQDGVVYITREQAKAFFGFSE